MKIQITEDSPTILKLIPEEDNDLIKITTVAEKCSSKKIPYKRFGDGSLAVKIDSNWEDFIKNKPEERRTADGKHM